MALFVALFSIAAKNKKSVTVDIKRLQIFTIGAPVGTRTLNLLIRSQTLYPIELRVHINTTIELYKTDMPLSNNQGCSNTWSYFLINASRRYRNEEYKTTQANIHVRMKIGSLLIRKAAMTTPMLPATI